MDQLIFASLSHTHYWYEVGMLKVPAIIVYTHEPGRNETSSHSLINERDGAGIQNVFSSNK